VQTYRKVRDRASYAFALGIRGSYRRHRWRPYQIRPAGPTAVEQVRIDFSTYGRNLATNGYCT
jgi:hypothetical protein